MDVSSSIALIAAVIFVLANAFFVASEFAIVAVRRSRLEQLASEGNTTAKIALYMVEHLDAYIAACQLGITMASLALGWIGEPAFAHLIEPPLEELVGRFAPQLAHGISIGVAFTIITAMHIVVGELAPKGLAIQKTEGTVLWVARPLTIFYRVFRWPITALNAIGNGILLLFGLQPATETESVHSVEELRFLVRGMREAGVVEPSEARIATRAFEFADVTAGSVMTPRTELEAVPVDTPLEQLVAKAATAQHSRLLVYDGDLDNILGDVHVHDILRAVYARRPVKLRDLIRPALLVPESKPADDLLEEMRKARRPIAVVVDEYGGTAGIVTIEDLVEVLVGPIEEELPPGVREAMQPEEPQVLDGLMRLRELEEMLGVEIEEEDHVETLGGLIMARLGRIPQEGDEVEIGGHKLRVEKMDGMRVDSVRLLN
ncbi:protein of unknown function DUF21 [Thermobaculum terrenum ATCC BAA-798]|uniref:CBS domain containing protein n=1 Tax=Thermobaculum terrenum (strain ATCC BAA-798 / CCMEE 7001 / YNP1) TaxID=525904 RepID=D1CH59_THET1|nr:hemolysin family protein [Thermobaculum terrenum]ACZ43080.1 protein of unknown function DUF21 [Thermobaculum terrenum ATCC BAA-798]